MSCIDRCTAQGIRPAASRASGPANSPTVRRACRPQTAGALWLRFYQHGSFALCRVPRSHLLSVGLVDPSRASGRKALPPGKQISDLRITLCRPRSFTVGRLAASQGPCSAGQPSTRRRARRPAWLVQAAGAAVSGRTVLRARWSVHSRPATTPGAIGLHSVPLWKPAGRPGH